MENRKPIFMSPTDGEVVHLFGDQLVHKITGAQTEGRIAIVESSFAPGHGPPAHIHHDEDEIFIIIKGTFQVCSGSETRLCEPGTIALLPKGLPHTFKNVGTTEGQIITLILPAHFANFFKEVHALPSTEQSDMQKVTEIAAKYHVEFLNYSCESP